MSSRPTIADVATAAGVGLGTASRALNDSGYVAADTKKKVLDAAARLGYKPNAVARALQSARSGIIGLLSPDLENECYIVSTAAIQRELASKGYQLMVAVANTAEEEAAALDTFGNQHVDGIIHIPVDPATPLPTTIPIVQINRSSQGTTVAAIVCDEAIGIDSLTRHLLASGTASHLALIVGAKKHSTTAKRIAGFTTATADADVTTHVYSGEFTPQWGEEAARKALADGADAIIAASPRIALGVVHELERRGVRIPADCQLASYSDPDWFSMWKPGMTTFVPPLREMGHLAVLTLLARIDSPTPHPDSPAITSLPGQIVVRGSTLAKE